MFSVNYNIGKDTFESFRGGLTASFFTFQKMLLHIVVYASVILGMENHHFTVTLPISILQFLSKV